MWVLLLLLAALTTAELASAQGTTTYFLTSRAGETYNLLRCMPSATVDCTVRANWTVAAGPLLPAQIPVVITHPAGKLEYSWEACVPGGACIWRSWERLIHDGVLATALRIGSRIRVTQDAAVRPTPGAATFTLQSIGATGVVVGGPVLFAWPAGIAWWQIDFATGADGWVTADRVQAE